LARLREICRQGEAAADADDFGTAVVANSAFHAEVAAIGGNAVLAELADIVGRRVQLYYRMVAPARGHVSLVTSRSARILVQAEGAQQGLPGGTRFGRRGQLVEAPPGLVEQAGRLVEEQG